MSHQYQQGTTGQRAGGGFRQAVSREISEVVLAIEEFETEAEWAKTTALRSGDSFAAKELEDLVELANLQKKLLVRDSWHAPTVGACIQEALQHGSMELQNSQVTDVQQVAQQAQQLAGTIQQATAGAGQGMAGHGEMGGQL